MADRANPLKGLNSALTSASTVVVLACVAVAFVYASLTVTLPEGSGRWLAGTLGVVALVFNFLGEWWEQSRLTTLRALGKGTLPVTPDTLERAAQETARAADRNFGVTLSLFTVGAFVASASWFALADVPASLAVRLMLIGIVIAPLTALLSTLVSHPRARMVMQALVAAGLPAERVRLVVPARFQLKRRLLLYGAIAGVTPSAMVLDVGVQRLGELLTRVGAATDPEAARLTWEAGIRASLLPLGMLSLLLVLLVMAAAWTAGAVLNAPVTALAAHTGRLARGEYAAGSLVMAEYETWAAATSIAAMEVHLSDAVGGLKQAVTGIAAVTPELTKSGRQHHSGAEQQALSLAATTATTEELARSARNIANNAQQVSALARRTLEVARGGKHSAEAFTNRMGEVRAGNQAIADSVVRLNKRVQQVGRIVEFIDGIADKSDLLALNAELEGNKAGEVGQGFSLVAAEMRRLAESVMTSTREIGRLIEEIRDATNAAVMATEAGVKATDAGSAIAERVAQSLSQIVDYANQTADAMASISTSTGQQQAGTDQLVDAMGEILRSTREGSEASAQMARANEVLVGLSGELEASLGRIGGQS